MKKKDMIEILNSLNIEVEETLNYSEVSKIYQQAKSAEKEPAPKKENFDASVQVFAFNDNKIEFVKIFEFPVDSKRASKQGFHYPLILRTKNNKPK